MNGIISFLVIFVIVWIPVWIGQLIFEFARALWWGATLPPEKLWPRVYLPSKVSTIEVAAVVAGIFWLWIG